MAIYLAVPVSDGPLALSRPHTSERGKAMASVVALLTVTIDTGRHVDE